MGQVTFIFLTYATTVESEPTQLLDNQYMKEQFTTVK